MLIMKIPGISAGLFATFLLAACAGGEARQQASGDDAAMRQVDRRRPCHIRIRTGGKCRRAGGAGRPARGGRRQSRRPVLQDGAQEVTF
jgi:hypothetical protein